MSTTAVSSLKENIQPFIVETFNFWYQDKGHIRSPFPSYIRNDLEREATEKFMNWLGKIPDKARDEINHEIVAEKFEEIIFETAIDLVKTEDEKLTLLYPFLPRLGDKIVGSSDGQSEVDITELESVVVDRKIEKDKEKEETFLKVTLKNQETGKNWETKFELPV